MNQGVTLPTLPLDGQDIARQLNDTGFALIPALLNAGESRQASMLYDNPDIAFRSTITMARHNFGRGEYKYFDYPLPEPVQALRQAFYPVLAAIANDWEVKLRTNTVWPDALSELMQVCRASGQTRPTPLMLRYQTGDYNCLHQDLYGEIHFPLQVIIQLSNPGTDFEGGELVLVEQRPRMQSRPMVIPLQQGAAVVIPVRERPFRGSRGWRRHQIRHGVNQVSSGERRTLGLIFHDAR